MQGGRSGRFLHKDHGAGVGCLGKGEELLEELAAGLSKEIQVLGEELVDGPSKWTPYQIG